MARGHTHKQARFTGPRLYPKEYPELSHAHYLCNRSLLATARPSRRRRHFPLPRGSTSGRRIASPPTAGQTRDRGTPLSNSRPLSPCNPAGIRRGRRRQHSTHQLRHTSRMRTGRVPVGRPTRSLPLRHRRLQTRPVHMSPSCRLQSPPCQFPLPTTAHLSPSRRQHSIRHSGATSSQHWMPCWCSRLRDAVWSPASPGA